MKRIGPFLSLLGLLALLIPSSSFGEEKEKEVIKLEDITVKGEAIPYSFDPGTVNTIGSDQFENLRLNRTSDILKEIPGIEIGNYNQGGVANVFSMRGFRSCGHGGDAAIYIDGIPLNEGESHADGYADMNVIIPLEIEKLEVYKGPSSVLSGNFARAGTVSFFSRKKGRYNLLKTEYGSFSTVDVQGAFGTKLGVGSGLYNNSAFQFYRTDGYQKNSKWLKGNFSTRFSYDLTDRLDASLSFRFHGSDWHAPGYIPEDQFKDEDWAKKQAVNAEDDGGKKEFYTQRLDLGYDLTDKFRFLYWAYSTQQNFTRFAKFGYNPGGQTERNYDRTVYGTGTSLNFDSSLSSIPCLGVIGAEFYYEETDWLRWNTSNRVRTAGTQDRKFIIKTTSLFGKLDLDISRYFRPQLGLRYDDFGGSYTNHDPGSARFKHDMNNYNHLSPKVGFRSRVLDPLDFRASYSEGFALPEGEAKYDPAINVDPVKIKQYEVGLTYTPIKMLWVDLSTYILDRNNEIQEDPPGSGLYRNVGETRRKGIELAVKLRPIKELQVFGDASFINTEVRKNPDQQLEGKKINGIPENIINLGAEYSFPWGLGIRAKWRHVGEYYIDSMNQFKYDGYDVVDTALSYSIKDTKKKEYNLTFRVDNLFDEHYSQAVWHGYGTNNYAVAWPRTFWAGLTVKW
ncbi:MAG: TonB-dependent receptor [Deltaproteobacteria bacterium]|nr:TonB-dependent receptor [Deltaproteobacteria bacterium]MBW1933116.1 TonB-dependent receptor [Deltaproteobacteria bacterium]